MKHEPLLLPIFVVAVVWLTLGWRGTAPAPALTKWPQILAELGHVAEGHRRFGQVRAHAHRRAEPRHVVDENEDDVRGRRGAGGGVRRRTQEGEGETGTRGERAQQA